MNSCRMSFLTWAIAACSSLGWAEDGLSDRFVCAAREAYTQEAYASYTNSIVTSPAFAHKSGRADLPAARGGLVRWVDVEGTANFRDIGGWNGLCAGRVWRGAEPNCQPRSAVKPPKSYHDLTLTEKGRRTLAEGLKIKTDLDLRARHESPTPDETPIPNARLLRIPCSAYTNFVRDVKTAAKLLHVFAEPSNYPIYFHCYGGADRTGSLAFVLEGLCGVNETDLCIDYELTSFSRIGRRARYDKPFYYASMVREMKKRPGATLTDKITWWAREECGLSRTEIEAIRAQLQRH